MICSVYFDRHAVAVPFTLLNDGSLAAQAISPAAAITGSPPAVVVVVGEALVVVGEALVVVVGEALAGSALRGASTPVGGCTCVCQEGQRAPWSRWPSAS